LAGDSSADREHVGGNARFAIRSHRLDRALDVAVRREQQITIGDCKL
jgi:hypothetical protein